MEGYQKGNAVVVAVVAEDCAMLWKEVEPWLERGVTKVVLDFAGVDFINSVNIAQVIAVRQRAAGHQAQILVVNLRDNIRAVFRILKLDRLFDLNLPLDAAVA